MLDVTAMMKALLVSAMLCTPALADPTPASQYKLKLAVEDGKDTRAYTVSLVDSACGEATQYKNAVTDEIKLCAHAEGASVRLRIDWQLKDKERMIQNKSELVVARKSTQVIDGGSAKLSVALL